MSDRNGRLRGRLWRALAFVPLAALTLAAAARSARAENMIAKFIRIDPEPTTDDKTGTPVIPMLIDLGIPVPINSFQTGCFVGGAGAKVTREAIACMSSKIEKEGYEKQFELPRDNAHVLSIVDGSPQPMEIVDASTFKDANAANAGIAWLILLDASSSVGSRWGEMQEAAEAIVKSMGANDAVMIRIMDDKATREHTKWLSAGSKGSAISLIRKVGSTYRSGGQVDSIIARVQKEALGSFQDLFRSGVDGTEDVIPLLQTLVLLSDGGDTSIEGLAGGTKAQVLHERLVKGDLGVEGVRLPTPVVSLWFPKNEWTGMIAEERRNAEYSWMSNMATPEVGGYFDIIQENEPGKGAKVARVVRNRFDNMHYVEAKASCLDTSGEQTFKVLFEDTKSKILPDTWSKVQVAFNATKWLLAVDKKKTEQGAQQKPLQPGEPFEVYGDFCWGTNAGAAEAYFVTESDAADVKKATADKTGKQAKALLQSLASKGQKAETVSASPLIAKFKVPSTPSLFENKPDNFALNVVILDTKSLRVSARDKNGLLQLRAAKAPINKLLIVGAIGGGVVLILLIAILARSGGGGRQKRRRGGAPPAPGPIPGQPPGPGAPAIGIGPAAGVQRPGAPPPGRAAFGAPPIAPARSAMAPPPLGGAIGGGIGGGTAVAAPSAYAAQSPYGAPAPAPSPYGAQLPYAAPPPAPYPFPGGAAGPSNLAQATALGVAGVAYPNAPGAGGLRAPAHAGDAPPQHAASPQLPPGLQSGPGNPAARFAGGHPPTALGPTPDARFGGAPAAGLSPAQKGATSFPTVCPNPGCRRQVLVPPGGTAQCAFCGTLVDSTGAAVAPIPAPEFGLTGAVDEDAAARAVAGYRADGASVQRAKAAGGGTVSLQGVQSGAGFRGAMRSVTLVGAPGTFRVLAGVESRVGRDGALCSIALNEPRISGVHASLKVEGGALLVRDDRSHNGTFVNGNRVPPGAWTPVPAGSQLRFGPIEFAVHHES